MWNELFEDPSLRYALITMAAMGLACAVLSVFIVVRRWAFIGEGISHGGLGGAGTAWLIALMLPSVDEAWLVYAGVVVFCLGMAAAIGYFTRSGRLSSDAVIGIFLVASVAWGFIAQGIYVAQRGRLPVGFDNLLFGRMEALSGEFAGLAVCLCLGVVAAVALLWKEILSYCFDPMMAEASGVRTGFVHYLLIVLLTITILIGTRVLGSILVIALLVLPGATALLLERRMRRVMTVAIMAGLIGVGGGLVAHAWRRYLPVGPAIALTLFAEFLIAYAATHLPLARRAPVT